MFQEKKGGAAVAPFEIGTRGTVGNLVMKEIEYFKRLESDHQSSLDPHNGGGANFWRGFEFLKITWRRKKRKGGGGDKFLPKVCTKVDVAESRHNHHHRANKIPSDVNFDIAT